MIILIDNYDSFTWNLFHFLSDVGGECQVHRNDKISPAEIIAAKPEAIILSPGPCTPKEAGIILELILAASGKVPILGVCLGQEAIGQAFGGRVIKAPLPVHGKISNITHDESELFYECGQNFEVARYHSLVLDDASMPNCLIPCASSEDGLIMAVRHKTHLTFGVQFHPESIATQNGHIILRNFLTIARQGIK